LTLASGCLPEKWLDRSHLGVDPMRALVTCLKPADDGVPDQAMVRLWETSGRTGVVLLEVPGYRTVRETDLLEREREALAVKQGKVSLNARGFGFSAVKLIR
jgi:alpha-mannosidase